MPLTFANGSADRLAFEIRALLEHGTGDSESLSLAGAYDQYQAHLVSEGMVAVAAPTPEYTFSYADEDWLSAFPYVRIWCDGFLEYGDREVGQPPIYEYTMLIEVIDKVCYDPSDVLGGTALEQLTRAIEWHTEPLRALLERNRNALSIFDTQDVEFRATGEVDSNLFRSVVFSLLIHSA